MFGNGQQRPPRIGEYDHGNGRRGTHPYRRNRIVPGPPGWIRQPVVEPVEAEANEPEIVNDDALYGERDRSFERELADLEVWE